MVNHLDLNSNLYVHKKGQKLDVAVCRFSAAARFSPGFLQLLELIQNWWLWMRMDEKIAKLMVVYANHENQMLFYFLSFPLLYQSVLGKYSF